MPTGIRPVATVALIGAAVLMPLTASYAASAGTVKPAGSSAPAIKPGLTGKAIVLTSNASFSGDDAVTDASGTAFIGWIGDTGHGRKVNLCVLPRGARACKGGVSQVDSLGDSTAFGLRVLLTGPRTVTLVWQYATAASETGPEGDEIAITTSSGGPLTAPRNVATAPSFGTMRDAAVGPNRTIWVVSEVAGTKTAVQVRPGFSNPPVTVGTPYLIGYAQLRFSGTTPVLVIDKDGAISSPVSAASRHGGSWSKFRPVAKTWTADANFGLASTRSGVRLIATVDNASYQPVVAPWTGSAFGRRTLTGDTNNCSPSSHDPVSDASGRLADVSIECSQLAIANLPDTRHAAVLRFTIHGTFAGTLPQLTTSPSGRGWVTWSVEGATADKLFAAPVLLPGRVVTVTKSSRGHRVSLTGPASCLPPVDLGLALRASGGSVASKVLRLNGTVLHSTTLHGGSLTPAKSYTLTGTVRFSRGPTITATLKFRTCSK